MEAYFFELDQRAARLQKQLDEAIGTKLIEATREEVRKATQRGKQIYKGEDMERYLLSLSELSDPKIESHLRELTKKSKEAD